MHDRGLPCDGSGAEARPFRSEEAEEFVPESAPAGGTFDAPTIPEDDEDEGHTEGDQHERR